jgi:predicted Zn-dependent protease
MKWTKTLVLGGLIGSAMLFPSCGKNGTQLNIFSIEDDKQLGLQTKAQIEADPAQFPILNPATHQSAYNYINALRDDILASGMVEHRTDFLWEVKIIANDDVQNAFCTPGGYIYVYTGLIKYLDSKSALAGVMGHEMAHADRRHSTNQLTKQYGVQTLLDVVLGKNQGLLTEVAQSLVTLRFSRSDESDADRHSVIYLCPTRYHSDGAAYFFQKIISSGAANPPEFLSTHPNPDNRVSDIQRYASEEKCVSRIADDEDIAGYAAFKASL